MVRSRSSLLTVRWVLVGSGVVLLGVVAGFVGYARHRANAYLRGLPGRLGVNITQESDNVTYSQSVKGRTIYTVRASKQIQHEGGRYTLRDVGIVMYGAKGDREDRIHGQEFEWDQKAGVMRAVGEVFIDLATPVSSSGAGVDREKGMIHVKTSGLVFQEKEKSAATDELVEFSSGEMTGRAVGASYDSGAGVLVLRSGVKMSGVRGGRPMELTAARAEMDRVGNLMKLEEARLVATKGAGEQTGSAARAVVHLTAEGKPTRVDAEGQVLLTGDGRGGARGTATGQRMELELNDAGQMRAGRLFGEVRLAEDAAGGVRRTRGQGAEARLAFDGVGRARSAVLTGGATVEEKVVTGERRLQAETVTLELAGGGKAPVVVTGARASRKDGAWLRMVDAAAKGRTETGVRAEVLTARFVGSGVGKTRTQVTGVDGTGKSFVERTVMGAGGVVESHETSAGQALALQFRPGADGRSELVRAEQGGGVTVVREARGRVEGAGSLVAAPPHVSESRHGAPGLLPVQPTRQGGMGVMEVEHARGDTAVYEKEGDRLTMTGGVEVQDAESALFAGQVVAKRGIGETTAVGGVRVSYVQAGSAGEPVHVMAARAVSHKATGVTEFLAEAGGKAKMWQGGSQVEAHVLEFDKGKRTVVARDPGGAAEGVRAVLVQVSSGSGGGTSHVSEARHGAPASVPGAGGAVRVWSREMVYRDAARTVEFTGGVRVVDQDGTMRAGEATVYLEAAGAGGVTRASEVQAGTAGGAGLALGGKVERMVGMGGVEMEQPGRRATGDRLVYTSADRTFVLTGTKAAPPKMVDEARGMTTGAALRFRSGEDRVEVSGTEAGSEARRVRTETKVKH